MAGTFGDPSAKATVRLKDVTLYGQTLDEVDASVDYGGSGVELISGQARFGKARVLVTGVWRHPARDYRNGTISFNVSTQGGALNEIAAINKSWSGVGGGIEAKGKGNFEIRNGSLYPQALDGTVNLRGLAIDGRALGDFSADARTVGRQLTLGISGVARGAKVLGNATVHLEGEYPVQGTASLGSVPMSVIHDLLRPSSGTTQPLPLEGTVQASASFSGPLRKPEQITARVEVPHLELVPARRTMTETQRRELTVRNDGTLVVEYAGRALKVRDAHLVGSETDLRLAGGVTLGPKPALDLSMKGNLNVGVLQNFDPDLIASGIAVVNASVRGTVDKPDLSGRMELRNASFYIRDFPNGLDGANGIVLFDQRRATIEKLTAHTGGGELALNGFVGFGGRELLYQLQGRAERVRIRYPEGVSTTSNAVLTLTGTTSRSLLTGTVTVVRAGFNPRTDIGGILASAPAPSIAPASQNLFLRGMQFDVRVETAPNLQFQTSLTTDLQA
ncbi:MAG TPA: hypothetical protein VES20_14425, partial [Bryobacteraceae bacterium]|nr:hypothetical protein [Bryobacteraceae bacterium]